nr:uncharacterized protein LOC116777521 [Danaus plexippus plexippus]
MVLKQLKNNKAPGEDGITFGILKADGSPVLKSPSEALQFCLVRRYHACGIEQERIGVILQERLNANRLERRFVDFQPPEQAHFRKSYSTVDYICTYAAPETEFDGDSYKKRSKTGRPYISAFEVAFKLLEWEGLGININGKYITHLRFADYIVVMAKSMEELSTMLEDLNRVSQWVGLKMNIDKLMSNVHVAPTPIMVENSVLEVVDAYVYLGQRV